MLEKIVLVLVIIILLIVILLLLPKVFEIYVPVGSDNKRNDILKEAEQRRKEKELEELEKKSWKPSRNKLYLNSFDWDSNKEEANS